MRSSFATLTIDRLRYPTTTDQGVTVHDYAEEPTSTPITDCWYEPLSSSEDHDARNAVRTGYTVDAPEGIDLLPTDHVLIAGVEHEVDGAPQVIPSPSGTLGSTRFTTKRWEG